MRRNSRRKSSRLRQPKITMSDVEIEKIEGDSASENVVIPSATISSYTAPEIGEKAILFVE